jgi:eukaryotic-like serine/threonine-protein kinase
MSQQNDASTRPATLAQGLGALDVGAKLAAGQRLGPYRLVRQLGEGGMGVVWLADQLQPFERKVAIKLSNRQSGSNMANAYFEIERQALAQLVHPYIAQIYDAGMRSDGMLYFAMEYVEGSTLDEFLVDKPVSLDTCIGLLAQICQGAHYAHQRGLIHRDLKPGNILIAEVSGSPMPKIIDFGIAIGVDIARTGSGASAGTRAYMAPEQFNASSTGLDLRADVYALGAILIEALCLQLKIPLDGVDSGTFRGLLSAAGTSANPISQHPHVPATLRSELRRIPKSLRAIAIKALSEDRDARYESAAAMADDLKRWRERRPVLAMQGGKLYAMRCFINRYRLASALGAATLAALIAGLIVASYGLQQAQIARAQAETRREQAEGLVDYMLGDFAAKLEPIGKLDLIDGVANRALEYLQQANDADQSSAIHRAAALRTIGDVQTRRGQWPQARSTFALADAALTKAEQANPGAPTAELLFERGQIAFWIGHTHYNERDYATAKIHWQRYLDFAIRLEPLTVKSGLGQQEIGYALNNLGIAAFHTGEITSARDYFLRSNQIRELLFNKNPNDEKVELDLSNNISWLARSQEAGGDLTGAELSYRKQLKISENKKESNPNDAVWIESTASARYWIGMMNLRLGNVAESLIHLQAAVNEFASITKLDSTKLSAYRILGIAQSELAWALHAKGETERALAIINIALEQFKALMANNPSAKDRRTFAGSLIRKSVFLEKLGESSKAVFFYTEANAELNKLHSENLQDRRISTELAASLLATPNLNDLPQNAARAKKILQPLVENQADADALDTLFRASVLLGDVKMAQVYEEKLNKMLYNHPNYRAFIARHYKGE